LLGRRTHVVLVFWHSFRVSAVTGCSSRPFVVWVAWSTGVAVVEMGTPEMGLEFFAKSLGST
jgi:hypothetical protein